MSVALVQQPRQRELRRRDALALGQRAYGVGRLRVDVEVLALEARVVAAVVVLGVVLGPLRGAGQEPAAQRGVRHEADAQLAQAGRMSSLQVALPQGVLRLERR